MNALLLNFATTIRADYFKSTVKCINSKDYRGLK